ncbi:MAG: PAS domain-containing sensor histidine kinase [Bacteroidales bacterium]
MHKSPQNNKNKTSLKWNDETFKHLIKNSFDIIVLLDAKGTQHYVSESCEKILGYKPEELIDIPVIEKMIHPDDQEKTKSGLQEIINNTGIGGTQYRHRHKNGGWVYLEAFGSNQINNPNIQSIILNVRDITQQKKVEQALKESEIRLSELNATKDKFFSIIAHDLLSPFNSIVGFSNLLANQIKQKDHEGIEKYAEIIKDSSEQALNLLTNLLEWSRAQTGKIKFNPEYFELVTEINEVIELVSNTAQQKSIKIQKDLPHNLPVFADKLMIHVVLRNLISNAVKFTQHGGVIKISAEQKIDNIIVSVEDNGVGIKEENMDKLFRLEGNYSMPGTQNEKGTGLGLLLCDEFIKIHKGNIGVKSEEGKGSRFYFSLPAK